MYSRLTFGDHLRGSLPGRPRTALEGSSFGLPLTVMKSLLGTLWFRVLGHTATR